MTEIETTGPRTRRSGRTARKNYSIQDQLAEAQISEDAETEIKLYELREHATRLGFANLFDVAMATARSDRSGNHEDTEEFFNSGGSRKLFEECYGGDLAVWFKETYGRTYGRTIPETPAEIYCDEWRKIVSHPEFRTPLRNMDPEKFPAFSFTEIYDTMKTLAPKLMAMFDCLSNDDWDRQGSVDRSEEKENARKRQLVMSLSILANLSCGRFNIVQGPLCFYFHGKMVSRKVHSVLHQLGITTTYTTDRLGDDAWQTTMETAATNKLREEFGSI
jgi:hypothetical protein